MPDLKQVIVIRKDLKMRRGKEIAQGAHASISCLRNLVATRLEEEWLASGMTKICVTVDSEQELIDILILAQAAGLQVHLITDAGKTEFDGVPTKTCLAIGPDHSDKIDKITGHLKLY
jgi:PTH2 family peptidyl-tRNA hydrolase